jgi:hypothetical protein
VELEEHLSEVPAAIYLCKQLEMLYLYFLLFVSTTVLVSVSFLWFKPLWAFLAKFGRGKREITRWNLDKRQDFTCVTRFSLLYSESHQGTAEVIPSGSTVGLDKE